MLFGANQLTVVRVSVEQMTRRLTGRVYGLECKNGGVYVHLQQVIWVRFKAGTLPQLLNQSTVPLVPKWNVHVTEHYLIVAIEGYIISAALELVIFLTHYSGQ